MEHDFIIFIDAHALVIKNNHLWNISWCWDEIVFGRMKKKKTVSMGLDQNKFNLECFFALWEILKYIWKGNQKKHHSHKIINKAN